MSKRMVSITFPLLLLASYSILRINVSAGEYVTVPNGSYESGTVGVIPDNWIMVTKNYNGLGVGNVTYINEMEQTDQKYFEGGRSLWMHSKVIDTDGLKHSRVAWTQAVTENWINAPLATHVRIYIRNIQSTHSLGWGWYNGIRLCINNVSVAKTYYAGDDYPWIFTHGEILNWNHYNYTAIGGDADSWYVYEYVIPEPVDTTHMKIQIECKAGDWTFYSTSYYSDLEFVVDKVELLLSGPSVRQWPMHGYDPACTSHSPSLAPSKNETAWIANLPAVGTGWWPHPVVAEGKVFIGAGGNLTAWSAMNGDLLWNKRAPAQIGSPSGVAAGSGRVFAVTSGNNVYASNATTGEHIWVLTGGTYSGAPTIVGNRIYLCGALGSTGAVCCVNTTTGALLWTYSPTQDRVRSIAVAYGKVYASTGSWETSTEGAIYCLDMYDGGLIWSFDTDRDFAGSLAVAHGKVYFSASYEGWSCIVYALNATNGEVVWSTTRYPNGEAGRVAVAYGKVFICLGYSDRGVYALNETDGDEVWAFPFIPPEPVPGHRCNPHWAVAADHKVFFGEGYPCNTLYAVNEANASVIWRYKVTVSVSGGSAAIANGRLFMADHGDKKLYAFGRPTIPTHDVAVVDVKSESEYIYQGKLCGANINVTVCNQGDMPESFDVLLYYNITAGQIIGNQTVVDLPPGKCTTLPFLWDTTEVTPCRSYDITAFTPPITNETDTVDNTLTHPSLLRVKLLADVNDDGRVDMIDIGLVGRAFGSFTEPFIHSRWNPEADIDQDNQVNMRDVAVVARNFGKTCG